MKRLIGTVLALLFTGLLTQAAQQRPIKSPVVQALEDEVKRSFDTLRQKGDPAPYFISYAVNEVQSAEIDASLGALRSSQENHSRLLDVDVRVGDYQLDSTHQIRDQRGNATGPGFSFPILMPIDNDVDALKSVIWLETDRKYKAALERFIQVKANRTIRVDEEDTSADLSREPKESAAAPSRKRDHRRAELGNEIESLFRTFRQIS